MRELIIVLVLTFTIGVLEAGLSSRIRTDSTALQWGCFLFLALVINLSWLTESKYGVIPLIRISIIWDTSYTIGYLMMFLYLGERATLTQSIGIMLAFVSIFLMK